MDGFFSLDFSISYGKMKCFSTVNLIKSMEMEWLYTIQCIVNVWWCLPKVKVKNRFKMHNFICTRASKARLIYFFPHSSHMHTCTTRPMENQSSKIWKNGFRIECWWTFLRNIFLSMSYEMPLKCMTLNAIRSIELNRLIADTNALWSKFDSVESKTSTQHLSLCIWQI